MPELVKTFLDVIPFYLFFKQLVLLVTTFLSLDFSLSNQNITENKLFFSERILLSG